jgi:sterol desaturase/sphingolipid hydroxylase (fatty acid hydroxylase superfamily)
MLRAHPWIVLVILAVAVAMALAEYGWRRTTGRSYDLQGARVSLLVWLGQLLLRPLSLGLTGLMLTLAGRLAPWVWPQDDWRCWAVGFVLVDLGYYGFHRLSHRVAWMWASHRVHHTARQIVLPAAVRLGWTDFVSGTWLCFVPLALLGCPARMIALWLAVGLLYQYWLHTEARLPLGPLEWLMNSPAHHRVHHASNPDYLDCNYGGVFIVWDRLFGSFRAEPAPGVLRYGLAGSEAEPAGPERTLSIALGGWPRLFAQMAKAGSWRAGLRVALSPPQN